MAKNVGGKSVGAWAFLVGVLLVLVLSIFDLGGNIRSWAMIIVLLVGIVVGFMNISRGETTKFILAAISLVIVSSMSMGSSAISSSLAELDFIGTILGNILVYLMVLVVPILIIVALKSVFDVAKN